MADKKKKSKLSPHDQKLVDELTEQLENSSISDVLLTLQRQSEAPQMPQLIYDKDIVNRFVQLSKGTGLVIEKDSETKSNKNFTISANHTEFLDQLEKSIGEFAESAKGNERPVINRSGWQIEVTNANFAVRVFLNDLEEGIEKGTSKNV